jgi:hypothetical protein
VFIAGAKLLDSVKPREAELATGPYRAPLQRRRITDRSRPRHPLQRTVSRSRSSRRTD